MKIHRFYIFLNKSSANVLYTIGMPVNQASLLYSIIINTPFDSRNATLFGLIIVVLSLNLYTI